MPPENEVAECGGRRREAEKKSSAAHGLMCLSRNVKVPARSRCLLTRSTANTSARTSISYAPPKHSKRGLDHADQAAVHDGRKVALREDPVPPRHVGNQEPGRLRRLQARGLRRARALEPG